MLFFAGRSSAKNKAARFGQPYFHLFNNKGWYNLKRFSYLSNPKDFFTALTFSSAFAFTASYSAASASGSLTSM